MSGEVVEGGRWLREQHGTLSMPLMVRPNTVLPVGTNENRPDYAHADCVTYQIFGLEERAMATARVPAQDGSIAATVEARRTGVRIEVSVQGASKPWAVLLRGIEHVASVVGGTAQREAIGTCVMPNAGAQAVSVRLEESV
jgi:alpha-D-xyloside xylohydrolase